MTSPDEKAAVSLYDRDQLDTLARIRDTDHPLVVFAGTGRLFQTEPAPGRGLVGTTTLAVTVEPTPALTGAVTTLLRRDLIHGDRLVRVIDLDGRPRSAHVLALTALGRYVRDLADRTADRTADRIGDSR